MVLLPVLLAGCSSSVSGRAQGAAEAAVPGSTGKTWNHVSPVSYETGSNTANWG